MSEWKKLTKEEYEEFKTKQDDFDVSLINGPMIELIGFIKGKLSQIKSTPDGWIIKEFDKK